MIATPQVYSFTDNENNAAQYQTKYFVKQEMKYKVFLLFLNVFTIRHEVAQAMILQTMKKSLFHHA
jgi:hypothetical protein